MTDIGLPETLQNFIAMLRGAGLAIDVARAGSLNQALAIIPARGLHAVFLAGRATLCATQQEIARFDACFAQFFFDGERIEIEILPDPKATPVLQASNDLRRRDRSETEDDRDVEMGAASAQEILRSRKLSKLSPDEKRLIERLIAQLRADVALYPGRRRKPAERGTIDVRRTVKAAQAKGGDIARLYRRIRRKRVRKRVLLLDISGSMAPFAPGLLRFGYAAYRCAPRRTEVFTVGTRLTRLTRCFDTADAEAANQRASTAMPDWSGGTRLGDQLKAFLDIWGQRGMARGAIVMIASDGWERGGAELLAEQMQRLQRLSHRIIWANPHKSTPGFEPLTKGMQAALPAVDEFVPGSSMDELDALIRLLGKA